MTIADMIAQRKIALDCILNDSNNAICAKGGTPADNLSGLQDAIVSIPSGGSELPELTAPAEVDHVLAGKEYIDGNGDKKSGTLVVCDTITEVKSLGIAGTGVSVDIESSADGSSKMLTIPEQNLLPENIVMGSSIFGVPGTAKKLRVETGTITPAEDVIDITIPAPFDGYCALLLSAADRTALEQKGAGSIYSVRVMNALYDGVGQIGIMNRYNGTAYSAATKTPIASDDGNIYLSGNSGRYYRAGIVYNYYVYYWEDT